MFGKNELRKQELREDGFLQITQIFKTIQGEGPYAGQPAIFLRLTGCNLACSWCDTDFEHGGYATPEDIVEEVERLREGTKIKLIVITGGEPLRQNIAPLVKMLTQQTQGGRPPLVQIETAGTLWVPGLSDLVFSPRVGGRANVVIIVSPKTGKVHPNIDKYALAWKYIIANGETNSEDFLPMMSTQVEGKTMRLARPKTSGRAPIFVQPRDDHDEEKNKRNMEECVRSSILGGYIISIQMHKVLDVE